MKNDMKTVVIYFKGDVDDVEEIKRVVDHHLDYIVGDPSVDGYFSSVFDANAYETEHYDEKQFAVLRSVINDIMASEPDDIDEYSTLGQFYADIHNLNQTLSDVEEMIAAHKNKHDIQFVSYDGETPNLCGGSLTLMIDGETVKFPKHLLISTGCASFDDDGNDEITSGPWTINESEIPDQYKSLKEEIETIVNENVPWGCCGGCL